MSREDDIREDLSAGDFSDSASRDIRYLLNLAAQLRLELTASRRTLVEQARRLSMLGAQRAVLLDEVSYRPEPVLMVHAEPCEDALDSVDVLHALRELHAVTGDIVAPGAAEGGRT